MGPDIISRKSQRFQKLRRAKLGTFTKLCEFHHRLPVQNNLNLAAKNFTLVGETLLHLDEMTEGDAAMSAMAQKVLIVDDDAEVLIALERLLEDEGYCTATAWSGQEAISLLQAQPFDLVLLDGALSDVDSSEVLQKAKDRPNLSCILLGGNEKSADTRAPSSDAVCKWEHPEILNRVRSSLAPQESGPRRLPTGLRHLA